MILLGNLSQGIPDVFAFVAAQGREDEAAEGLCGHGDLGVGGEEGVDC